MNAALLHYAAPPVVGGVETVLAKQAQQLVRAGHRVKILAGRGASWDERIPVVVLPLLDSLHPRVLAAKASLDRGEVPLDFEALMEEIQSALDPLLADVDVLIVHNAASLHKNLALTAALQRISQRSPGPRMVLWHHDLAWTAPRYQAELHPGWPWDLLRTAWPGAVQVVVSETRRVELAHLYGIPEAEITVIPAGVDLVDFLKLSPSTQELAERHGLYDLNPLLLTPVRLTRRKNLELALQIVHALRERMPRAGLVITGPPGAHNPANLEYLRELQRLRAELGLEGAVHLLAESRPEGLAETEIDDLYRLADALLITSREEGFGIPLLEAGLSRIPIFCTDLVPLRALANDFGTYFSPDANPQQVAEDIFFRLSSDPGYQMRARVRGGYTWQAIYDRQIAPLLEKP